MKTILTTSFLLFFACAVFTAEAADTIVVKKDPRLDVLSAKQVQVNKANALTGTAQYKGYRIQVISTNSRDQAFGMKNTMQANYPDQKVYLMYLSPNFRVRVGNFLKRDDAENFRKEMNKLFPEGLYIVEDTIEVAMSEEDEFIP